MDHAKAYEAPMIVGYGGITELTAVNQKNFSVDLPFGTVAPPASCRSASGNSSDRPRRRGDSTAGGRLTTPVTKAR